MVWGPHDPPLQTQTESQPGMSPYRQVLADSKAWSEQVKAAGRNRYSL